jgi:outer membrane protein, multidrug efflux system
MRLIVLFSLVGVTAWTAACAVKDPPPPADLLKSALTATPVAPAWTGAAPVAGSVETDWIRTFNDPALDKLVEEGLRNNLDLQAAAYRVDAAQGLVVQARSLLYPQISVIAGVGAVGRSNQDVFDKYGAVGEVSWELDLWGRVRSQAASKGASREAVEADLLYARQSLAATIAKLWYQAVTTEQLRLTAENGMKVYNELLHLVSVRKTVGRVGQQDVVLAGADLDRARRREREFGASKQQVTRGLEIVLGRYPSAELELASDVVTVPPPIPDGLPSDLLERRPDLVAAERRVAAAFYGIQSAKAARLPKIALTAAGGRSTNDLFYLLGISPDFWSVGLGLLAPIFTGGQLKAQVEIATAEQRTALALYGQAALRAFSDVETSLANERLLEDQQRYLEAVVAQDSDGLRLRQISYKVGATDLLSVLDLQNRLLNAQLDLVAVRNDRLANRIGLHLALGGGFIPPSTP